MDEYKSLSDQMGALAEQLGIDVNDLGSQVARQSQLYDDAAKLAATLKAASKRAALSCDEIKAGVETEIRKNPEVFGLSKVTEGAIKTAVTLNDEVRQVERSAIDLQELADKASATERAFDAKRRMLSDEVRLFLGNYFGEVEQRSIANTGKEVVESLHQRISNLRRRRVEDEEE